MRRELNAQAVDVKKSGIQCTNCIPMQNGNCSNQASLMQPNFKIDEFVDLPTDQTFSCNTSPDTFTDSKMKTAIGVKLLNSEGIPRTERMELIWERSVHLTSALYRIPGGSIGRRFTSLMAKEIQLLAQAKEKSERSSIFGRLLLQKDKQIKKTADIKRLISRRMDLWEAPKFEELIQEAEQCDKKLGRSSGKNMTDESAHLVFSRLILQGKLREATRFITQRGEKSCVLKPDDDDGKGNTVKSVLESKHPPQAESSPEAFIVCEQLPTLVDIDVSSSHVL